MSNRQTIGLVAGLTMWMPLFVWAINLSTPGTTPQVALITLIPCLVATGLWVLVAWWCLDD